EGKTQQEAAQQLGWRLGTLATRVLRGRELLRSRLTRRGLALSAAGLTVALTQEAVSAAPSTALVASIVGYAVPTATGAAGAVPVPIKVLVTGVVQTMMYTKIRKALLVACAVILLGGAVLFWRTTDTAAEPAVVPVPITARGSEGGKGEPNKDHQ